MATSQPPLHKAFKEIKIHTAKCDQCNKHNSATIYRCEDCSEQCCTPCWNLQGADGKHLLNHAQTVIIPPSEVKKRRPARKKPAKTEKKQEQQTSTPKNKVEKKSTRQKAKVAAKNDGEVDDVEMEVDVPAVAPITALTKKTTWANKKQMNGGKEFPDGHDDSSDPDADIGPIPHSKDTISKTQKLLNSRLLPTNSINKLTQAKKRKISNSDLVVEKGDTTEEDIWVERIPSNKTYSHRKKALSGVKPIIKAANDVNKEITEVSKTHKRKHSAVSPEDLDSPGNHHVATGRKKARTGIVTGSGVSVGVSSQPQTQVGVEDIDTIEGAETLINLAKGATYDSPTPSPPFSKTVNGIDAPVNTRAGPVNHNLARSSSPFADLPVWPPAPAPKTKTAGEYKTFPPSRDYYGQASPSFLRNQAKDQAQSSVASAATRAAVAPAPSMAPAPRDGMMNRTWVPHDTNDQARAKVHAEYQAGVNADLAVSNNIATDIDRPPKLSSPPISNPNNEIYNITTILESPDHDPELTTSQALDPKIAREAAADKAYQRILLPKSANARSAESDAHVGEEAGEGGEVIEVVETITETGAETPMRKGMAHVKNTENAKSKEIGDIY